MHRILVVEDTPAFAEALGDKAGVRRFGSVLVPLDEVLVQAAVDLSGRPYLVYEEPEGMAPFVGGLPPFFATSLARHFWESFALTARITLHVVVVRGSRPGAQPDAHHIIEAQFKAVARALRQAVELDPRVSGVPSTKGSL